MSEISNFSREIRDLRYRQIYDCVVATDGAGASVNDIAQCLGVKATPYLRDVLQEMVQKTWLTRQETMLQTKRGFRMGWKFYIPSEVNSVD